MISSGKKNNQHKKTLWGKCRTDAFDLTGETRTMLTWIKFTTSDPVGKKTPTPYESKISFLFGKFSFQIKYEDRLGLHECVTYKYTSNILKDIKFWKNLINTR